MDSEYVEPYAGGASVALGLLYDEYVRRIFINDIDKSVYAFWYSVLNETESLCRLVRDTPLTMEEWRRQREIQLNPDSSLLERGYSTFFLNRTNRSGIISGGVIGGKNQTGKWLIDARYRTDDLISRIEKVARYRRRIILRNLDAIDFLREIIPQLTSQALIYLDPPYYIKGKEDLYINFYKPENHAQVAEMVRTITNHNWIVSYDDVPQIRTLYEGYRFIDYFLSYSAQKRYKGPEIIFFCHGLEVPEVIDPAKVKGQALQRYLV
jgi:DNA adenine methylase